MELNQLTKPHSKPFSVCLTIFFTTIYCEKLLEDIGRTLEIPEAWIPTIRQHNNRSLPQWTAEGSKPTNHERGSKYNNH